MSLGNPSVLQTESISHTAGVGALRKATCGSSGVYTSKMLQNRKGGALVARSHQGLGSVRVLLLLRQKSEIHPNETAPWLVNSLHSKGSVGHGHGATLYGLTIQDLRAANIWR